MKVVALAGGVGGAKFADGLYQVIPHEDLTIIVNTGDDFHHFGLNISPDLDTVCYNLAGIANPETGWGRKNETYSVMDGVQELGGPCWFSLGDKDLATHLERTRLYRAGLTLTKITKIFLEKWQINCDILPMTDFTVRTQILTSDFGLLPFQEYFVLHQCKPIARAIEFLGIEDAEPASNVIERILGSDIVVVCPSNPWLSIWPILSIKGVLDAIKKKKVVVVTPLIGGKAFKGPAAKIYHEFGISPNNVSIAEHYQDIITMMVIDYQDDFEKGALLRKGIIPFLTNIKMSDVPDRKRLATEVIRFAATSLVT
jgi:LPPG:FO 2-phospho-L-lactate transferase